MRGNLLFNIFPRIPILRICIWFIYRSVLTFPNNLKFGYLSSLSERERRGNGPKCKMHVQGVKIHCSEAHDLETFKGALS